MEHQDDILSEAIEQVRGESVRPGPPRAVVETTLERLAARGATRRPVTKTFFKFTTRTAAAAAVLLLAGYTVGRLTAPAGPDIKQLEQKLAGSLAATIEPMVRESVLQDVSRQWRVALTACQAQLKEDLTQQYQADLNRYAIGTLAASNQATNQLLDQLVQAINTAQTQKMQWVAKALREYERRRLDDRTQLAAGIEALAYRTEDGLQQTREEIVHQTREDMVHLLATTYPAKGAPEAGEIQIEERIEK